MPDRMVWVADEFRGPDTPVADPVRGDPAGRPQHSCGAPSTRFDLLDERRALPPGRPGRRRCADAPIERLALLRIDAARCRCGRRRARRRLRPAQRRRLWSSIDGCDGAAARGASNDFRCAARGSTSPLAASSGAGSSWRKLAPAPTPQTAPSPAEARQPSATPLAPPPCPTTPCDLSVVVVFHNMRREAERTLHSLVPRLPAGDRGPRLRGDRRRERLRAPSSGSARTSSAGFGPGVPLPRPRRGRHALPRRRAQPRDRDRPRRRSLALMIDGAHVLTPGVLRYAMQGCATYAPAMVATQQWYVGPGQQVETIGEGYDQDVRGRGCSSRSSGRATATGCSRSATSSAPATGSTACGRATACSCRARRSSRSACSTRRSRCPAAASPTSTCSSGSAPRRA